MKIAFISNFMSIHQLPLAQAFYNELKEIFIFIETTPIDDDRKEMGFEDFSSEYDFILPAFQSDFNQRKALEAVVDSDVVILGSAPKLYEKARLKTGKLTFKYSERFFKGGGSVKERVRFWLSAQMHIKPLAKHNLYFLCASAYTAADVNRFADFNGRTLKWGYFSEIDKKEPEKLCGMKKKNSILWVGRLIDWKHPELALALALKLKSAGLDFTLKIVGNGEMYPELNKTIEENGLQDRVMMLGAQTPEIVRDLMDENEIFISTSDYKEGWGVVINEAMNSCCCIVASHAMGSVPFLISNGYNGMIFESGKINELFDKVKLLLNDPDLKEHIAINAYNSLEQNWKADIVAKRLISISGQLLAGQNFDFYQSGPCSKAEILLNDWYSGKKND